ncbi:hypothetical protein MKX03_001473, partial [Papaver bracteatum]
MNNCFTTHFLLYFLMFFLIPCSSISSSSSNNTKIGDGRTSNSSSGSNSCGDLHNIRCPLTLEDHFPNCPNYTNERQLSCVNNRTIWNVSSKSFYVIDIDYDYDYYYYYYYYYYYVKIRLIDPGLEKDNCSSMPQHSVDQHSVGTRETINSYSDYDTPGRFSGEYPKTKAVVYMNCLTNMSDLPHYLNASPCVKASSFNTSTYVVVDPRFSDFNESCKPFLTSWMSTDKDAFDSYSDVHREMTKGFVLHWNTRQIRS